MKLLPLLKEHYPAVAKIYKQGINTGLATFETEVPSWEQWNKKHHSACRWVLLDGEGLENSPEESQNKSLRGWGALAPTSSRHVYRGVAEVSVYIDPAYPRKGYGEILLRKLISDSEAHGFWTLQSSIMSENIASIELHKKCGFREIGFREKVGALHGKWHDNVLLEKRSKLPR
jgi:phosphinothricin acetyltransferase